MNYKKRISLVLGLIFPLLLSAQAVKVEIVKNGTQWQLLRNGQPYYIKGAGGQVHLDKLVEIGGNSIRTWSLENAQKYLDEAQKHGLTVTMGLWVQHERHGFDYNDEVAVKKQLDYFTKKVKEFKDHPALLMWGVGNEVDLFYKNTKVWNAVQDIAKMIHEIDPNHPTTTVTAGLHQQEVKLVKEMAPDIDIFGVNTYGDLKNAVDKIGQYGWKKAYLIAEWGPDGHWEVPKTSWGAPIEQSSAEKAVSYAARYQYLRADSANCIGSYVFLWGQKQETTATWYGMFSKNGESTATVDALYKAWRNATPPNTSPDIVDYGMYDGSKSLTDKVITAQSRYQVKATFKDLDGDKIKVEWQIVSESTDVKAGGDAESAPPAIPGLIKSKKSNEITFEAPKKEGPYRVFISAYDGKGNMAYVNIPFYVKPNAAVSDGIKLKKRTLTFEYE